MKLLVTGGSGFLGKEAVRELKKAGHEVEEFNMSAGQDIRSMEQVLAAVKGKEAVVHLAAFVGGKKAEMWDVNVIGTHNVLEACSKEAVKRLVYCSSVGVYGDFEGKANEGFPIKPVSAYEESKADAEKIVWSYLQKMDITILRPTIIFGASNLWKSVFRLAKKDFPVIGSGENRLHLVHVKDAASAFAFVLENRQSFGQAFNLAAMESSSLKEFYELVYSAIGKSVPEKHISPGAAKRMLLLYNVFAKNKIAPENVDRLARSREYSVTKILNLGWKPKYDLKKAVKEVFGEIKGEI